MCVWVSGLFCGGVVHVSVGMGVCRYGCGFVGEPVDVGL